MFLKKPNESYWFICCFFQPALFKRFVAMEGVDKVAAGFGKIVGNFLVFSPCLLIIVGWVRWWRIRPPRHWRNYAVAWGLAAASISALCLYCVLSVVHLAHLGHSNEH